MDAADRFARLVGGKDAVAVDEGALLIATHLDPRRDPDVERERLDQLARSVREPTLDGVRGLLFDDLGLTGDRETYYDPRNSLLPEVLDRRRGIPISLAVVTMAVARRVGVPVDGVAMPGHFLLRDRVDRTVFLDPFDRGVELDRDGCEARFRSIQGSNARFDPAWLEPATARDILLRMLSNLRAIHRRAGRRDDLARVLQLMTLLPDGAETDLRAFADVLEAQGRFAWAADVYDRLASGGSGTEDGARAQNLRARLN